MTPMLESHLSYNRPLQCRDIPRKYGSYRGKIRSSKPHLLYRSFDFESGLERDLLLLLDHDFFCYDIQAQPGLVNNEKPFQWTDSSGNEHLSYPNFWSIFLSEKQILWQVKSWKFLTKIENSKTHQKVLRWKEELYALGKECTLRNWEVKVVTELDIRTPRLINVNILRGSALHPPEDAFIDEVIKILPNILSSTKGKTFDEISKLIQVRKPSFSIGIIRHTLRYLMYYQKLMFDWYKSLKKHTLLFLNLDHQILLKPFYQNNPLNPEELQSELVEVSSPPPEAVNEALKKYQRIKELLVIPDRSKSDVQAVADTHSLGISTIYRWLKAYEKNGLEGLIVHENFKGNRKSRNPPEAEAIISKYIQKWQVNYRKTKITKLVADINRELINKGFLEYEVKYTTIAKRIRNLEAKVRLGKQGGFIRYEIPAGNLGELPTGAYPLASIQLDHTLLDISLVDSEYRMPIGRPYLTIGIDTYSRMIYCYHLSFHPPNSMSVSTALMRGILPKEKLLKEFNIDSSYPIQGIPQQISVDNAKEFDSKHLEDFCNKYNIDIQFREVKRPDHGAFVERLFGTLKEAIRNSEIHGFAHPLKERPKEYNPDKAAERGGLTLWEFEEWMLRWILPVYHQRIHSTLEKAPLEQYKLGINASGESFGNKLLIRDTELIRFHIMPISSRKHVIHPSGIRWNDNWYNARILTHIRKQRRGKKKKTTFVMILEILHISGFMMTITRSIIPYFLLKEN